ncbi:MAG: response regulator transcription factor [Bryobacteraceae bacterium]|nr:response regulator transcription factor [Bryobacteraceae bacterium]
MADAAPLTLLVADEFALIREGVACLCETSGRFRVVAQAADGEAAWARLREQQPDLALLDLALHGLHVLEIARRIEDSQLPTRAGILTLRHDRKTFLEILRAQARGIFLRSDPAEPMLEGLERMAAGGIYVSPGIDVHQLFQSDGPRSSRQPLDTLSAREHQVFSLLVEGIRAKEIAARLNLSPKTVDTYRSSLMRKLDIHDVAGLVKFAIQHHLTE